jgi:hypothetical protein
LPGTTWLKAISFALLNQVRHPDIQQHPLLTINPHILVPFLELDLYNKKEVPDLTFFYLSKAFLNPFALFAPTNICKELQLQDCAFV